MHDISVKDIITKAKTISDNEYQTNLNVTAKERHMPYGLDRDDKYNL